MAEASSGGGGFKAFVRLLLVVALLATGAAAWWAVSQTSEDAGGRVALVTADDDAYWDLVIEGAQAAASDLGVELVVHKNTEGQVGQSRLVKEIAASGVSGIAISPVNATKQAILLRDISMECDLVTLDSDSELSGRICFVGADNYTAGRRAGELVKAAMPDGGTVAIVMGPMDKDNGRLRRQGIIDELLDRSFGPGRPPEPMGAPLEGASYTIVATRTDAIDPEEAKANVAALLDEHADLGCIVGVFAYHAPAAIAAITEAGATDSTQIVGFDDRRETIDGILAGTVFGTVAQDQFNYGYNSIRLLAEASTGVGSLAIPLDRRLHFPPVLVTADSLESFMAERDSRRAPADDS